MSLTLQLVGITKRFSGVIANDRVSLTLAPGEIHVLLGENGAGKSTLMHILSGFLSPDAGDILVNGVPVQIASPADARGLGIGMVHQDFLLVPGFTVAENIVVGNSGRMLNLKQASARMLALSQQHHLDVDPDAITGDLPLGVQQRVAILKLLYGDARILILDEPTAILTPLETVRLFAVLRSLREQGRTIVLVTHKLQEALELADRITILRRGRVVVTLAAQDTNAAALARLIIGRDPEAVTARPAPAPGPCLLSVEALTVRDHNRQIKVDHLSLDLRRHEVLGIAGVEGNGQSHLAEALMNLRPIASGSIRFAGETVTHLSATAHHARGIAYVPADRRAVGSVATLSLQSNAILGSPRRFTRRGFFENARIRAYAEALITSFDVRPASLDASAASLSGGNLQKFILGRELIKRPRLLIVEHPTRGLDIAAVRAIRADLLQARDEGTAILLISSDLDELMHLATRVAVMYAGRIVGSVDPHAVTAEQLGLLMSGAAVDAGAAA